MTSEDLLELQKALVSHLADPDRYHGLSTSQARSSLMDGIDLSRLELLGLLVEGKRISKVQRVLPRTFACLDRDVASVAREFSLRHPPLSASSFVNACQFYIFLKREWRRRVPHPPFLPDLAYCELSLATLARSKDAPTPLFTASPVSLGTLMIRRRPWVHLRRCQYNIQSVLDSGDPRSEVGHGVKHVIMSRPLDADGGRMFDATEELFEFIRSLSHWRAVGPAREVFANQKTVSFLGGLEAMGIVEGQLCAFA